MNDTTDLDDLRATIVEQTPANRLLIEWYINNFRTALEQGKLNAAIAYAFVGLELQEGNAVERIVKK